MGDAVTEGNEVAVVTGGACGIAPAVVKMLMAGGVQVLFAYTGQPEAAAAVEARCAQEPGEAIAIQLDVQNKQAVEALIAQVKRRWGRLDMLVNTTAIAGNGKVGATPIGDWQATLAINLNSVYHVCKAAIKPMMRARYGRIVNVTGLQGMAGSYGQAAYSSAAGGILGLTRALAREVAPWNITVNAVVTGLIAGTTLDHLPEDVRQNGLNIAALRRVGTPEEAAYPIVFLASRGASFITGQTLAVDGGWTMA